MSELLVTMTDNAAKRVYDLLKIEGNPDLKLRLYITGGGCSGFQYGFAFDEKQRPDDNIFTKTFQSPQEEVAEVRYVVDALSMMYLSGSIIDYLESLRGSQFSVTNPNAQTTCSCGSSFALNQE